MALRSRIPLAMDATQRFIALHSGVSARTAYGLGGLSPSLFYLPHITLPNIWMSGTAGSAPLRRTGVHQKTEKFLEFDSPQEINLGFGLGFILSLSNGIFSPDVGGEMERTGGDNIPGTYRPR